MLQAKGDEQSVKLDDLVIRINALVKRKAETDEKLRGLTVVSHDSEKYKEMTLPQLTKELGRIQKDLNRFEHVNKKAIDQFEAFKEQQQELEERSKDLDESMKAAEDFMKKIDEQKEATLVQTLRQIDTHFGEIFSQLVRGGCAKIRMLRPDDDADDDGEVPERVDRIRGVRVEVSFSGQATSFLTMSQLSGGQKTVVAIAIIFAIQRLDPAPFYLFDEIDAALDTQYRTAVARLVQRDAQNAQMVITTFRKEIIETADRFYRVYQRNRVSRIECVPRQEAQRVIEEQTRIERPDQ